MRSSRLLTACLLTLLPGLLNAEDVPLKAVHIADFFHGQLEPLPLQLKIPAAYVYAEGLEVPETYAYWMLKSEVAEARSSGDLPGKTGYVYGKVSEDVGWLPAEKKFSHEETLSQELAEAGHKILATRRLEVGGHAMFSVVISLKTEAPAKPKRVYMCYVATNIETNAILFSYTPAESLKQEDALRCWEAMVDSFATAEKK